MTPLPIDLGSIAGQAQSLASFLTHLTFQIVVSGLALKAFFSVTRAIRNF